MPDKSKYDLQFRPQSYWDKRGPQSQIQNIKGELRRRLAKQLVKKSDVGDLEEWMTKENLNDAERSMIGRTHPLFMGGEYLPNFGNNEVEIARILLKSTTGDVISLRARHQGSVIEYQIVDEYGTQFKIQPEKTVEPLSMGELIRLIDGAEIDEQRKGLTNIFRSCNLDEDPMDLLDFVTVSSEFYPDLERWYRDEAIEWCEEAKRHIQRK